MPAGSGSNPPDKSEHGKTNKAAKRRLLSKQKTLTRARTLRRIKQLLAQDEQFSQELVELLSLFHFQADDLTEAGICYEVVKALEKRYPLLLKESL